MCLEKWICDVYGRRKDRHRVQRSKMSKGVFFDYEMQKRFKRTLITE